MDEEQAAELDGTSDVHALTVDGRSIILVGTAHISRESAELVREVIAREHPDAVCVELDRQRYQALTHEDRWENLDLRDVIRRQQLATLLMNLMLASYQKRLGAKLGMLPGSELLEAVRAAEERGIPVALCDRDVRVTLRRAWHAIPFFRKPLVISALVAGVFEETELSEEDLRKLRQQDVLSEVMRELGQALPALKRVLIDERDAWLAHRILETPGQKLVAVVGAGHVEGMKEALAAQRPADLAELDRVPPVSPIWKAVGWSIPALIVGSIVAIGWTKGLAAAGDNALYWFLATGIPSAVGTLLAFGHPLTVVAAFLAAPITTLSPLIGVGYVTALVQTWLRPPKVREFETVGDDMTSPLKWWRSRLLRVLLVFLLSTLGGVVGTWVGGVEVVSNLFPHTQ